jgi:hypothetical protein
MWSGSKGKFDSLTDFITRSDSGDRWIYHAGNLAIDRTKKKKVDKAAKDALAAQERGDIRLFQQRSPFEKYQYWYIAEKV